MLKFISLKVAAGLRPALILITILLALTVACNNEPQQIERPEPINSPAAQRPKIVAFGDSLTAGLGLSADETYPVQLQKLLDEAGYKYEVVNAGVSGDTTSGGLRRVDWVLDEHAKVVVLELGANDILRGQPIPMLQENLSKMIETMQSRGITVLLAGMEAPTNSGPEYRKEVHDAYRALAEKYQTPFIPFILQDVLQSENYTQEDLSHPNAEGAKVLAKTVFNALVPVLTK
jgi:acyl-CoA thioesterase I